MSYLLLAAVFLAVAAVVAAVAWRRMPRGHAIAIFAAVAVLLVLTAVFDTVMIASGLFAYSDGRISGARIGLAPVEDFAYPIAGALLLSGLWSMLARRPDAD